MTVKSLLDAYWNPNHFVISIEAYDTDPQYDYTQTFFSAGDYNVIEGSAFDNAQVVTPVFGQRKLPIAVGDMEVFEFGVIDEVLIITIHPNQVLTEDDDDVNDAAIAMRESLGKNWW